MEQKKQVNFTGWDSEVLANNDKALEVLYTSNYYKTAAFIVANNGNHEQAKDIYQDAFMAAWQNIKAGKFVPQNNSSVEAYLFQIAKYKWYDYLKASKKITVLPVDENEFVETVYNKEEEAYIEKVQHHFKQLGEQCRQVLTLYYFMKQSMSKIAAVFSWTEATAKNNKYRCLQRLRNMVVGK
jgi:RNA polymerase sigma factor (sigma-70 family)